MLLSKLPGGSEQWVWRVGQWSIASLVDLQQLLLAFPLR